MMGEAFLNLTKTSYVLGTTTRAMIDNSVDGACVLVSATTYLIEA